jgi:hypothetical protein
MRGKESHRAIDAQGALAPVRERELRILGEAEDVAMRVDDQDGLRMPAGCRIVPSRRWLEEPVTCGVDLATAEPRELDSDGGVDAVRPALSISDHPPRWPAPSSRAIWTSPLRAYRV